MEDTFSDKTNGELEAILKRRWPEARFTVSSENRNTVIGILCILEPEMELASGSISLRGNPGRRART